MVSLTLECINKYVMDETLQRIMLLYLVLPKHLMKVLCPVLGTARKKYVPK